MRRGFLKPEIVPYDPKWVEYFDADKKLLQKILRGFDVTIEHVGSTSVVGLSAKPCIDIIVGVRENPRENIPKIVDVLARHGFVDEDFFSHDTAPVSNEVIFPCIPKRKNRRGEYINFVHIATVGSPAYQKMVNFGRDYLREFPAVRAEYEKFKYKCAEKESQAGGDFMEYTRMKEEFLGKMRADAKKYYNLPRDDAKQTELNEIWAEMKRHGRRAASMVGRVKK